MAKPAGSRRRGARGSLRPGICGPNCASHRGFGIFEGIVCRDIRHWRMIHAALAKGHERVFLRTLLSNFPSICSRQRIADSIANFFVYRYLAFKRRTRRGLNKSLVVCPHPFLNFTRIDLGHGSGRAHSKGRHDGCKCGVEFQSNHFPNWLVTLPSRYKKPLSQALQWQGHRRAYSRAIISTRVGHALKKCAT